MNETQRMETAVPAPTTGRKTGQTTGTWFRWWVAACLVLLAISSCRQLAIQNRILARSHELQVAVAEAAAVSAATNQQLNGLQQLDDATTHLASQLQRMVNTNAAIRTELAAMEANVQSVSESVPTMDRVTQESAAQLSGIARASDQLQAVLGRSLETGRTVSQVLNDMARVQDAVTANLGEMVDKTEPLQRFVRGD